MSIQWVPGCGSRVPSNAVPGGLDRGTRLYVARALHAGSLVPGKLHPANKNVYVRWVNTIIVTSSCFQAGNLLLWWQLWRRRARQEFRLRDLDWGGFPVAGR